MGENVFIQATAAIFNGAWTILTAVRFPGTNMPIAMILVGAFLAVTSIRILAYVLKMSVNTGSLVSNNDKISKRRGG
jgi:hypothetical protein